MAGLQNLPVIAFAFLCLMYLSKEGRWNFVLGCLFLALAISASGGGIILCAVGFLLLVEKGKRGESAVWLGVSLFILILYFYHYNFASSQQESHGSLLHSIYHLNALFAFLFLGSAVGSPHSIATMYAAGGLGCVLCAAFLWATKKRYYRKNPTIYYFMVFTIFTAVGVSAIRSGLGYEQAITSHYKIYSDLLIISFYIFILEQYLENRRYATQRFLAVGICGSILFCIACDIYGYKFLKKRRLSLETGVQVYDSSGHSVGPNLLLGTLHEAQSQFSGNQTIRLVIAQAEASGLYRLPRK